MNVLKKEIISDGYPSAKLASLLWEKNFFGDSDLINPETLSKKKEKGGGGGKGGRRKGREGRKKEVGRENRWGGEKEEEEKE